MRRLSLVLLAVLLVSGCGDGKGGTAKQTPVESSKPESVKPPPHNPG